MCILYVYRASLHAPFNYGNCERKQAGAKCVGVQFSSVTVTHQNTLFHSPQTSSPTTFVQIEMDETEIPLMTTWSSVAFGTWPHHSEMVSVAVAASILFNVVSLLLTAICHLERGWEFGNISSVENDNKAGKLRSSATSTTIAKSGKLFEILKI